MDIKTLAERINAYKGGRVTHAHVEDVLDFNIMLEQSEEGELVSDDAQTAHQRYLRRVVEHQDTIANGNRIVRQFALQLPQDIHCLRDAFYTFMSSVKYHESPVSISVARTVLSSNWDGISGWRD